MATYRIGQLAQLAGVAVDTLRYYERNDLLAPEARMASGYRRYGETELRRLRFIRRAKALGFSLDEIRDLLALGAEQDVARIRETAQQRLDDVERRIAALQRVRDGLRTLIRACPGHGRAEACPILQALSQEDET
jgi:MerR family copper efflux transcriptional regulator